MTQNLQVAMESVKQDKTHSGLCNNFEETVATLLPDDPVSKKQVKGYKHGAEISLMKFKQDGATVSSTGTMNSGKG